MARNGHNKACDHVARNVQNICSILAIGFFIFGISLAAIVSGSLEVRGSYFLIYGCTPALSCYVSGQILRHSSNFTWKLCELAAPRIGRGLLLFGNRFLELETYKNPASCRWAVGPRCIFFDYIGVRANLSRELRVVLHFDQSKRAANYRNPAAHAPLR